MPDVFGALRTIGLTDPTISGLVESRVFVNKIPTDVIVAEDTRHPRKILVFRMAGGGGKADLLPVGDRGLSVLCYGENDYEADRVLRVVEQRFFTLSRELVDGVLIHHINSTGGPSPLVDPDIVWPAVRQPYTIKAQVLEVA